MTQIKVFQLPAEFKQDGDKYGLCIFNFARALTSPPRGYYERPQRYFEYYSISHLIKGRGKLWMPDIPERQVRPGHGIIMPPHKIHKYGAADDIYCEDQLCFIGPIADQLYNCGIIQAGIIDFGTTRRLLPIMDAASCPSTDSLLEANLRLQRLLLDLYLENRDTSHNSAVLMDKLLKELKRNICHWWTISEMSEYCQVSEGLLRKLFKNHTGMLPKQYLDRLRMRMAATMLIEKKQTIKEIAESLGYKDRFHFSRRFKAITGISPQVYRKRFRSKNAFGDNDNIPMDTLDDAPSHYPPASEDVQPGKSEKDHPPY